MEIIGTVAFIALVIVGGISFFSNKKKNKQKRLESEEDTSSKLNPTQELVENLCKWHGIRGEAEFNHQPEEYQMRASPENKVTLGMLLHKALDVREEELSDLYVVSDYQNGVGELIKNRKDIWAYDLCSHLIEHTEAGYEYKDGKVVLIVAYKDPFRDNEDEDKDRSINRRFGTITIHLSKQQGGSLNSEIISSFYICATICMSPMALEKHKYSAGNWEKLQPKALSVTFAFDTTTSNQKKAEYEYLHFETIEKIKRNKWEQLTVRESFLCEALIPDIGKDYYWGGKALEEKRFWDAILYFSKVYDILQEKWNKEKISEEEERAFFESCYQLGFCYSELELYEKALYYLEIVWRFDVIKFKMEYINCLANKKDFRAIYIVEGEIERLSKIEHPEWLDWYDSFHFYYNFLLRRIAYIYIDKGKLEEAETILKKILENDMDEDFAIRELAYIQEIKKRGNNE